MRGPAPNLRWRGRCGLPECLGQAWSHRPGLWLTLLILCAAFAGIAAGPTSAPVRDEPTDAAPLPTFEPEEFLLLPLRIHVLRAEEFPKIDAQLRDEDIFRIVAKANRVWGTAGVRFLIESLVHEPAAELERVALAEAVGTGNLGRYRELCPEASRSNSVFHVYFVHEMEVNGVYLGHGTAFVKDTAELRAVEGGIDEPIPRVMSHELGHALGLAHRQDDTNLMASGTTGTAFNADEVERVRDCAQGLPFARTACDAARQAGEHYQAGRWCEALKLDAQLVTLPGCSSLKDAARARVVATARRVLGSLSRRSPAAEPAASLERITKPGTDAPEPNNGAAQSAFGAVNTTAPALFARAIPWARPVAR